MALSRKILARFVAPSASGHGSREPRSTLNKLSDPGRAGGLQHSGQAGGAWQHVSVFCDFLFQQKPLNPRRHHRPNKETKTSLNSVVPNRVSVAPGSTSMRPALCVT